MTGVSIRPWQSQQIAERVAAKFARAGVDPKRIVADSWVLSSDGGLTATVAIPMSPEDAAALFNGTTCDCASIVACWCDFERRCPPCAASRDEAHTCATEEERREFAGAGDVDALGPYEEHEARQPTEAEVEEVIEFLQGPAFVREPTCVENWANCVNGEYNPACCRWPKSCSVQMIPAEPNNREEDR
ncbi:hypothetical protein [Agromyces sp. NPDC058064]|uniref:hypothetical protein n=1 Tax=Agromyces sp. NPDC058064 TaxID=3346322 RepID=UPI0036D9908B